MSGGGDHLASVSEYPRLLFQGSNPAPCPVLILEELREPAGLLSG